MPTNLHPKTGLSPRKIWLFGIFSPLLNHKFFFIIFILDLFYGSIGLVIQGWRRYNVRSYSMLEMLSRTFSAADNLTFYYLLTIVDIEGHGGIFGI